MECRPIVGAIGRWLASLLLWIRVDRYSGECSTASAPAFWLGYFLGGSTDGVAHCWQPYLAITGLACRLLCTLCKRPHRGRILVAGCVRSDHRQSGLHELSCDERARRQCGGAV